MKSFGHNRSYNHKKKRKRENGKRELLETFNEKQKQGKNEQKHQWSMRRLHHTTTER